MSDSSGFLNVGGPSGLTDDEANYIYNVEVLGLPPRKAAQLAGMPVAKLTKPHIMQAREHVKRELRGAMAITKDDVVFGMRDAIDRARILGEPATEIAGWKEIARILGYDAAQRVDVNLHASIDVLRHQVRQLSDEELMRAVGADSVIDADFYVVRNDA